MENLFFMIKCKCDLDNMVVGDTLIMMVSNTLIMMGSKILVIMVSDILIIWFFDVILTLKCMWVLCHDKLNNACNINDLNSSSHNE